MPTPESIFDQRIPTLERPSRVVDRVRETAIFFGGELVDFFTSPNSAEPGDNIRILLSPDPEVQENDPLPGFMLWGLGLPHADKIGGADFDFAVGWRMYYPSQQRFRDSGKPDAGNLVWKFRRAIRKNPTLVTMPLPGSDQLADLRADFVLDELIGLDTKLGCVDLITGTVVYRLEIDKDDV